MKIFYSLILGSIWPRGTIKKADKSAEKTCQSKNVTYTNETEMMDKQSLDFISFFSGDDHQPPSHHLKLNLIVLAKQVKNISLTPRAGKIGEDRNFH